MLISHASKIIFQVLQARLQQYLNREFSDVWAGFKNDREIRNQIVNICWIKEKAKEFQKKVYFCFIDCTKAFECVDHNKLWKVLKEMETSDHLTCLLRKLHVGQETTVRVLQGTTDLFKIGKGLGQGSILSPVCLTSMQSTSCEMPGWISYKL